MYIVCEVIFLFLPAAMSRIHKIPVPQIKIFVFLFLLGASKGEVKKVKKLFLVNPSEPLVQNDHMII